MEIRLRECTVPSENSSWVMVDQPHLAEGPTAQPRGILQERNANSTCHTPQPFHVTSIFDLPASLSFPASHGQTQAILPIAASKHAFAEEVGRQCAALPAHLSQDVNWVQRETQMLWERLMSCAPFLKYRNGQSKDEGAEQKWSERMEVAFWRAAVYFPPVGRKQQRRGKGNPKGRNQIISDLIYEWTGEERTRKQVSSHIQVLKPFVQHDPLIAKYLFVAPSPGSGTGRTRRSSRMPSATQYNPRGVGQRPDRQHAQLQQSLRTAPISVLLDEKGQHIPTFAPYRFEMFIQDGVDSSSSIVHMISQLVISERSDLAGASVGAVETARKADLNIGSPKLLQEFHPILSKLWSAGALDSSQVIMAEASLSLCVLRNCSSHGLGVYSELTSDASFDATEYEQIFCRTTFYQDNRRILHPRSDEKKALDRKKIVKYNMRVNVPFGSKFWAYKMATEFSTTLKKAAEARAMAAKLGPDVSGRGNEYARFARLHEQQVRESVRRLTAVQQITGVIAPQDGTAQREQRLLTIVWSFSQAGSDKAGTMSWRQVTLPPSQTALRPSNHSRDTDTPAQQEMSIKDQDVQSQSHTRGYLPMDSGIFTPPCDHESQHEESLSQMTAMNEESVIHSFDFDDMGYSSLDLERQPLRGSLNDVDFTGGHIEIPIGTGCQNLSTVDEDMEMDVNTSEGLQHHHAYEDISQGAHCYGGVWDEQASYSTGPYYEPACLGEVSTSGDLQTYHFEEGNLDVDSGNAVHPALAEFSAPATQHCFSNDYAVEGADNTPGEVELHDWQDPAVNES